MTHADRLPYQPSLDGLRGIAVLTVMAFHAGVPWMIGGFLGVDVFFVLSGFLITSLLTAEWARTGTIRLRAFYARRALRLLPALLGLCAILQLYALTFVLPEQVQALRRETLATLLYVANWAQAFGWVLPLGFLAHTWSLGIEEQFYLAWPVALRWLLGRLERRAVLVVVLTAAAASALLRAWLWNGIASFPRVFFGFDTRAEALLLGSAAALLIETYDGKPLAPSTRRFWSWVAALASVALLVLVTRASWLADYMYAGIFTVVALAASLVIVEVYTSPTGLMARGLAFSPLVAVGWISYGLYLWHWPIFLVLRPEAIGLGWGVTTLLRFTLTFAVAILSYVAIERRFLRWKQRFVH